jgi:hypothetical protein
MSASIKARVDRALPPPPVADLAHGGAY